MSQVALTNDHATLSKISAELNGYFGDKRYSYDLVGDKQLSLKHVSRSPLINIGYTIRVEMIRYNLKYIIGNLKNSNSKFRIFSLGSGFDNTYHWLTNEFEVINFEFIEIDMESVIADKISKYSASYGYSHSLLESERIYMLNDNLYLVPLDLYNIIQLEDKINLRKDNCVNIWLSECALCYLDLNGSNAVISFVSSIPNSYLLVFEQLISLPHDPFSKVMINHFINKKAPILTPLQVDGEFSQFSRFSRHFANVNIKFMSQFFYEHYNDISRVLSVQQFDEWEELDLFLLHYALTIGNNTNHMIIPSTAHTCEKNNWLDFPVTLKSIDESFLFPPQKLKYYSICGSNEKNFLTGGRISLNSVESNLVIFENGNFLNQIPHTEFSRFRHSSVVTSDKLFIVGGIKQQARKSLFIMNLASFKEVPVEIESDDYFDRIHHSITANSEFIFIIGGVSAASKMPLPHLRLHISTMKIDFFEPRLKTEILPPLRYHSCAMIDNNTLAVVGGLSGQTKFSLSHCFFINLQKNSFIYSKLRNRENRLLLSPRVQFVNKELICHEERRLVCFSMGSHCDQPWSIPLNHITFPTDVKISSSLLSTSEVPYVLKQHSGVLELSKKWSEEYLEKALGEYIISLHKCAQPNLKFYPQKNFIFESINFSEAVKRLNSDFENFYYFRAISRVNARKKRADFWTDYPPISKDVTKEIIPIPEDRWHSSILRMSSSRGLCLWLHYDVLSNFLIQIRGKKWVTLWPPSDLPFLYIQGSSSVADLWDLENFPLLALGHPIRVLLEPGDVLFIPALWFHHVQCVEEEWSLALNIFFKELPDEFYPKKDLFGNADPEVDPSLLPQPFKSFYTLKREMGEGAASAYTTE
jgi:tRNA wybutosine-synthesizing protein 5